jgi:2-polyprenyl-6-hydroxyphenyl methylase/3-demethylubiquinone-9 3-methyltransferase
MKMKDLSLLGLTEQGIKAVTQSLSKIDPDDLQIKDIWKTLNNVWDELGCNNRKLNWQQINSFYAHPVWLLNGLFAEHDKLSMQNRQAIANWIISRKLSISSVLDWGGGFGTLSRLIGEQDREIIVDIYEPHPSKLAITRMESFSNIHFINSLTKKYDCLVSTDVLEHVPDPLKSFAEMISLVNTDGYLIIANCFYPVIKCHLPTTFHLRFTFNVFAQMMGVEVVGVCEGSHDTVYKKVTQKRINWLKIRISEKISRLLFPIFEINRLIYIKFLKPN